MFKKIKSAILSWLLLQLLFAKPTSAYGLLTQKWYPLLFNQIDSKSNRFGGKLHSPLQALICEQCSQMSDKSDPSRWTTKHRTHQFVIVWVPTIVFIFVCKACLHLVPPLTLTPRLALAHGSFVIRSRRIQAHILAIIYSWNTCIIR